MEMAVAVFGSVREMLNFAQSLRVEGQRPNLSQIMTAAAERLEHPIEVHRHRIESDVEAESKQVGRPAALYLFPHRLVFLHQREYAAYHLLQHGAEIGCRVFCVVQFGAEET